MFDKEMTRRLAELSKIDFTEEELEKMTKDMTDIIALMDQVRAFDSTKEAYSLKPVTFSQLRPDQPEPPSSPSQILANAKKTEQQSFTVPKVV